MSYDRVDGWTLEQTPCPGCMWEQQSANAGFKSNPCPLVYKTSVRRLRVKELGAK